MTNQTKERIAFGLLALPAFMLAWALSGCSTPTVKQSLTVAARSAQPPAPTMQSIMRSLVVPGVVIVPGGPTNAAQSNFWDRARAACPGITTTNYSIPGISLAWSAKCPDTYYKPLPPVRILFNGTPGWSYVVWQAASPAGQFTFFTNCTSSTTNFEMAVTTVDRKFYKVTIWPK